MTVSSLPGCDREVSVPVVEVIGLTKRFGAVTAIRDLTVSLPRGTVGVVGANGAGKSTLLRLIMGLVQPDAGRIAVLGEDVALDGPRLRSRIGYVPEHDCLPPRLTAGEFVAGLALLSGIPTSAARDRAADVCRQVGLGEAIYRPMGGCSTGTRQRIKLAQALVHGPELILLDEPTNGLDPQGREDMLGLVARLGDRYGVDVVITSHLVEDLQRVCGHLLVLDGEQPGAVRDLGGSSPSDRILLETARESGPLQSWLSQRGVPSDGAGRELVVTVAAHHDLDATLDLVRDGIHETGSGLARLSITQPGAGW